jgi:hypothetical protein
VPGACTKTLNELSSNYRQLRQGGSSLLCMFVGITL